MANRRQFIQFAAGTVGMMTAQRASASIGPFIGAPRSQGLRILVLGGTGFIGPHIVRSIVERGHAVSIFNRGRSEADLPPNVEELIGDRADDLTALHGRTWDAVIDNSATNAPKWVRDSAQLLKDAVGTYLFTSTRSVYSDFSVVGMNEDGPIYDPDPSAIEEGRRLSYGEGKALSEREVRRAFGDRMLIVRPGLIVGPGDETDRFTYWPVRIDSGGEVLAPGDPNTGAMFIDVRDLADFYVHLIEQGTTGVFNALGPASPLSFAELLYGIRAVTSAQVSFTWVDTDFLLEREVRPYGQMPLWMPARGDRVGFQQFDLSRPLAAGIKYRPLAVTARDTLEFHKSRPLERQQDLRSGMPRERERELLAEWHGTRTGRR
jgi:2'-hydroxyisoflavone reductase